MKIEYLMLGLGILLCAVAVVAMLLLWWPQSAAAPREVSNTTIPSPARGGVSVEPTPVNADLPANPGAVYIVQP
jgi:hypothetical protein